MSTISFGTVMSTLRQNIVNVTRLRFYRQGLRPVDLQVLADALKENRTFVELDLSYNDSLLSGTPALAKALKENKGTSIRKLVLNDCRISDRCAIALAECSKRIKFSEHCT